MDEIKLNKRCKYAGDIFPKLIDIGFGIETATDFLNNIKDADVVEVVRCKDCKHGRKTNRIMSPEKFFKEDCVVCECEDVVGDEPMIYGPTHFCSYGTPKERGGEK